MAAVPPLAVPAVVAVPAVGAEPPEAEPPEAVPAVPAIGLVKVQYGATHLAPWLAHLQSASVVHQPSLPTGVWLPAGLHAKALLPIGEAADLVQLQTASPHAVPGQSMSL